LGVDPLVGVRAETVHVPPAAGQTAVTHQPGDLVGALRGEAPEVPLHVVVAQAGAGHPLLGVDEVRELDAIADEEHRRVVTDEVVVALGGVELDREAARVAPGVRAALLTGDRGEPDQHLGLRPRLEQRGAGVGRDVLLGDERAERTAALGVHDPLRDPLAVELCELLHGVVVVQHDRAGVADRLGVRVAGDRGAGGGGGHVSHACLLSSCWFLDRVSWSGTAPVRVVSWSRGVSSVCVVSSSGTAAQAAQIPWKSTSAARIRIPPSSEGARHGAWPTTQETSSTAPHRTHITWWWLSPVRVSYRAGDPGVTSLRSRPSSVRS